MNGFAMRSMKKSYLETNDSEDTTTKNLADRLKPVLRGQFIALQAYLKKQEKVQINNLTLHLKELERVQQIKPKVSRRKDIIKVRAKINETESRKTIHKVSEIKSWFYEKIKKIDQL